MAGEEGTMNGHQCVVGCGVGPATSGTEVPEGGERGAPAAGSAGRSHERAHREAVRRMAGRPHRRRDLQRLLILAGLAARADERVVCHRGRLHIPVRLCIVHL